MPTKTMTTAKARRIRPLLLVLLWVWAGCVFLTLDLFLNVQEFDSIRPRSNLYRGMRIAGHKLVGERYHEGGFLDDHRGTQTRPSVEVAATVAEPTALIEGRVYRPDGATAAGAVVAARDAETAAVFRARTAKDGTFRLPVPPERAYQVAAVAAGSLAAVAHRVFPPARVHLVFREGARIAGRAVDEWGRGVEHVVLRLTPGQDLRGDPMRSNLQAPWLLDEIGAREATTGRDGGFALDGVSRGAYRLVVMDGPVRVGEGTRVHVPGPGEVSCEVLVHPAPPVLVAGTVRDGETGQPLPDTVVEFIPGGLVHTDDNGAFRAEAVPQGRVRVEVRAPGRPPLLKRIAIDVAPEPLDLRVPAGRVVTGQVLRPDGAPCAGARVSWQGAERERVTDDAGRFRFKKVAPRGWGMITVKAPGCATARTQIRPGQADVLVRLARGARIEGRVLGPGGAPRPDVSVRLMPRLRLRNAPRGQRMDAREVLATRTDEEGRYHFEGLPAGVTTIVAVPAADSLAPAAGALEVLAGAVAQAADLQLRAGVTIEGRVIDTEQRPVAGALVLISSPVSSAVAVTDAGGNFVLTGRTEDFNEVISVTHAGYAPGRAYRRAQQIAPLRIRLRRY